MRLSVAVCALACLVALAADRVAAQGPPTSFDVVSITPYVNNVPLVASASSPDRFEQRDTTLGELMLFAYDVRPFQVVGDSDWMSTKSWNVSAKAPVPVSNEAMRMLVRRMLEDRFALKAHIETRQVPIYNLVLARRDRTLGPKIKPATVDCTPYLTGKKPMQESPRDPNNRFGLCSVGGAFTPAGLLTPRLNGQPLTGLIQHLEEAMERRVIDRTGLKGNYDIELSYLDESLADPSSPSAAQAVRGPSLFAALQEQLGMKLESARGPVKVLVVDAVAEPTTN